MYEQQGNGALNDFFGNSPLLVQLISVPGTEQSVLCTKMFFSLPSLCQKGGRALVVAACMWVSPYVWLIQVAGTHQQRHHGVG